jgi:CrcB protein
VARGRRACRALSDAVPSWTAVAAVGIGAAVGAWLRWGFTAWLNPLLPALPLGTLVSNLVGGLLMGVALELMARYTAMSPEWRLLLTTGFLGGLTTFSTFSGEITLMLLRREMLWATLGIVAHVAGSIVLTIVGILLARALFVTMAR